MDTFGTAKKNGKDVMLVRAYRGDAMTLLAMDLDPSITDNFVGFSIGVKQGDRSPYFLYNRLSFSPDILQKNGIDDKEKLSSSFSPFQKFRWVHVPSSQHYVDEPFYGNYTYEVTPRYLVDDVLQPLDPTLTASVPIEVSPFRVGEIQVGYTRAFVSSQAYTDHFGNNTKLRPNKTDLLFDIKAESGTGKRFNPATGKYEPAPYTFEDQHAYLGWQARDRIVEFLDEALGDTGTRLDVFAYDLDEPVVVERLIELGAQGRARIILDDSKDHRAGSFEQEFEKVFKEKAKDPNAIVRGHFQGLSHSKVFIQLKGDMAIKTLTGSTNFTTNGMYINANHVIVFSTTSVSQLYEDVFKASFGKEKMATFRENELAKKDHVIRGEPLPDMTLRFSPHPKETAASFFKSIKDRIDHAGSDVLFAIMNDRSKSGILDAVRRQVQSDEVFTYGITDTATDVYLYKPNSKRGVRVAGKGTETALPPPFNTVAKIPGIAIHHKFIVVDFRGRNSVVYCGSSNLAFGPEQKNGDNLIEIRNDDVVTAFAIEAIRLVDHFHWRNKERTTEEKRKPLYLSDNKGRKRWYKDYYNPSDLHCLERTLLSGPKK